MKQGYLIYAQGDKHLRYAIACAESLKSFDQKPICLVSDKDIASTVFDNVVVVEKNSDKFHVKNRSKLIEYSPFEETTVIESDCLITQSLDNWWTKNKDCDLKFISQAYTYRQEPLDISYDRKTWAQNDLPNLYVACHYFKKTEFTKKFFNLVYEINTNEELYKGHLPNRSPKVPSMDVAICLATKLLDCNDKVGYTGDDPMFIHMKPYSQGLAEPEENWSEKLGFYKNSNDVYIANFKQQGILHFIEDVV